MLLILQYKSLFAAHWSMVTWGQLRRTGGNRSQPIPTETETVLTILLWWQMFLCWWQIIFYILIEWPGETEKCHCEKQKQGTISKPPRREGGGLCSLQFPGIQRFNVESQRCGERGGDPLHVGWLQDEEIFQQFREDNKHREHKEKQRQHWHQGE